MPHSEFRSPIAANIGVDDKSWMALPHSSLEFSTGVEYFLDKAFERAAQGDEILCPCIKCKNRYWAIRSVVNGHLVYHGFVKGYTQWVFHGEGFTPEVPKVTEDISMDDGDDIENLLQDTFRNMSDGPTADAIKFFMLVKEGQQELYPGCKNFTTLSFTIRLYLFKCLNGLSNKAFGDLLELLKEAFPDAKFPDSFNAARKIIRNLGLDYEKIHACPNDCMLFWDQHKDVSHCLTCGASRWKLDKNVQGDNTDSSSASQYQVPAKVLRYFPLKPRLQRLYMCSETATAMRWHAIERPKDGKLRHPADGQAWKDFDSLHSTFAQDHRNVRLGLTSDGFNPFRTMSISHSTWPVVLINYNLAPWICMKPEYFFLSLLIPGPSSPGKDIDVYMQPLIKELKELWEDGVETYDVSVNQAFFLRAALTWTISDFPAYAMLSGWSTKGKLACPSCNHETSSQYLKYSRKTCYMGHRRFLDANHIWRFDDKSFDGHVELRGAPSSLSGTEVVRELSDFENVFGKNQKKKANDGPWRKRSIFFELSYWEHNTLRHNLDVMHIEKNICDSILGTLLDISGKTKDHLNSRFDLKEMGIREELQPIFLADGKVKLAKAGFSMTEEEKMLFCTVLKEAKLPQGCASNISRCVQLKEKKISGYKSHDAHFILHFLIKVAVRKTLPKPIAILLIKFSDFFRGVCSKVISLADLEKLQAEIVEILCRLEMHFPPSFFDIMVHLPIHLVEEIKLGGPVHCRWMYGVERDLCILKASVRNRSCPEGSIAEGYLAEECLVFCSRYMHDGVKTRFSRYWWNDDRITSIDVSLPIFPKIGHPIGGKKKRQGKAFALDHKLLEQAHRYALFNCQDKIVEKYIKEHQDLIQRRRRVSRWAREKIHSQEFAQWFQGKITNVEVPEYILWLSKGPNTVVKRYAGYFINGYRFHTRKRDARCKTQNSGVTLKALTPSFASSKDSNPVVGDVTYHGAIEEIIELDYWGYFSVVLFRCVWFQVEKDEYGLNCVNINKLCYPDDPFVMASQVHQIFYVKDPIEEALYYVIAKVPRDLFDLQYENCDAETFWGEPNELISGDSLATSSDNPITWIREDAFTDILDVPLHILETQLPLDNNDEDSDFDDTDWDWMSPSD
ncbi:uncharacterized protein LOC126669179 [Mercurialis annua]|uniref:uncharacterized protein LOC130014575 n=1 Tax=Mercurialis annua TaxID=3986 RepID=UPI0021605652|nr:uncharacterized protein LOC130014575 [Mercurialis annua]XP_055960795.1 uncharacterized protein LOC126669179 [Mercurialis annua]